MGLAHVLGSLFWLVDQQTQWSVTAANQARKCGPSGSGSRGSEGLWTKMKAASQPSLSTVTCWPRALARPRMSSRVQRLHWASLLMLGRPCRARRLLRRDLRCRGPPRRMLATGTDSTTSQLDLVDVQRAHPRRELWVAIHVGTFWRWIGRLVAADVDVAVQVSLVATECRRVDWHVR